MNLFTKHFHIIPTRVDTLNKNVQSAISNERYNLSKDFDKEEIMLLCNIFGRFTVLSDKSQSTELAATGSPKTIIRRRSSRIKSRKRKRID